MYTRIKLININLRKQNSRNIINQFKFARKWSIKKNWVREKEYRNIKLNERNIIIKSRLLRKRLNYFRIKFSNKNYIK